MDIREYQENGKKHVDINGVTFTFRSYLKFAFTVYAAIIFLIIAINLVALVFQPDNTTGTSGSYLAYVMITTAWSMAFMCILIFVSYPVYRLISKFRSGQRFTFREEK